MSLPRIVSSEPVVIPAGEEKTYPDIHLTRITIDTPPPRMVDGELVQANWTADVRYVPFNYDTGEALPMRMMGEPSVQRERRIRINDVRAESETDPLLAQAMGAILAAVQARLST